MMRIRWIPSIWVAALAASVACAQAQPACTPAAGGPAVTLEGDIQPVLNERCVVCHITGAANAGLNMQPGMAFDNLVGVASSESALKRIEPGDPDKSYLVHKIRGTHVGVGGSGAQMPMGQSPLETELQDLIVAWVAACAPRG
jgi:hypothetical protein